MTAKNMFKKATEQLSALRTLTLPVVFIWEGDDGPDSYDFIRLMKQYADESGGRVVKLNTYDVQQVDKEINAGRYIYIE